MFRTFTFSVLMLLMTYTLRSQDTTKLSPWAGMSDEQLHQMADTLAHRYIITDTHIDLPERLMEHNLRAPEQYVHVPLNDSVGEFDYVRAKRGGLDAPFMSIYVPSSYQKTGGAKEYADSLIDMVREIVKAHPDKFYTAFRPSDVERNSKKGVISLPMGMENGAPIGDDLKNVSYFYKRGIRYITLTHATDNKICDSSYDTTHTWNGLSPFGREVVKEMNRVGIMVDISHVSDSAFYQAVALSIMPCIASHSSARFFTPGFERNMNDDMLKFLASKGGVIQISFGSVFLTQNFRDKREVLRALLAKKNLKEDDPAAKPIIEKFKKDNPDFQPDASDVAKHIDHVVKLVGINHVGIGSDFDGVGGELPRNLGDVSQYPNLIYELMKLGYSEEDISKICYKNLFRVWNMVLDYARHQAERAKREK